MLMFAAEHDGSIIVSQSTSETSYQAGGKNMESSQKPKEIAIWDDAIAKLLKKGYIRRVSTKNPVYRVTTSDYDIAERFKSDNGLDTDKSVAEILIEFGA